MSKLSEGKMRPVEVKVAAAICRSQGDFTWRYLRDVDGNPSTAYAYYEYLRMGRAAVRCIEKLYSGGSIVKRMREDK